MSGNPDANSGSNSPGRKEAPPSTANSLISVATKASAMQHQQITEARPPATAPLHSPSFSSHASAVDVASSEVSFTT